jgi:hypothetical protein
MPDDVFANLREITCQAGSSKSIAAFPDVCMTPPENPATPPGVPVPYPNFGMASDTTDGSTSVSINGKPVLLKNQSHFKKSSGDEAGSATKKGVISSVNRGKVYFVSWSPDVKVEGKNVVRHLDLTTHNHASSPANEGIPWPHLGRMDLIASTPECSTQAQEIKDKCGDPIDKEKARCPDPAALDEAKAEHEAACAMKRGTKKRADAKAKATVKVHKAHEDQAVAINNNACTKVLQCALVPYNKGKDACCPGSTPDHLVPAAQFGEGRGGSHPTYSAGKAPCMCASGGAQTATHGLLGQGRTAYMKKNGFKVNKHAKSWSVSQSCKCGAVSAAEVTGCNADCLEAQLKKGHKDMNVKLGEKISTRKETVAVDLGPFQARLTPASAGLPG